jgi:glycosyltransferase involved in cell wall biosynthesis
MKISVVIPTYNRRTQVLRAIDSVRAQTVPVDEIIVVDDGSSDGTTGEVQSRYGSGVRIFSQKNGGAAAARNRGIREAQGEWTAFLDSDDVWLSTKIERQLETLTRLGGEFGVCFTDSVFEGNPGKKLSRFQEVGLQNAQRFGVLDEPVKWIVAWQNPFYIPSVLVRRRLLQDVGCFDQALVLGEDTDLLFRLSFRTRFCFVAEQLVRIDRNPIREFGLEKLLSTRDDRRYDSIERMYTKWLTMPEVAGSNYEQSIRELLRLDYYSSIEAKIHEVKLGPAFRRMVRLKALGDSYPLIVLLLFSRKIKKLRRRSNGSQ